MFVGTLSPGKQGSPDLSISDTIHGLAKADYSLFDQFATRNSNGAPSLQPHNLLPQQPTKIKHEYIPPFV